MPKAAHQSAVKPVVVLVHHPVDHIEVAAQEPRARADQHPKLVQLSEEIQLCCIRGRGHTLRLATILRPSSYTGAWSTGSTCALRCRKQPKRKNTEQSKYRREESIVKAGANKLDHIIV
jgi:hypothetical protein